MQGPQITPTSQSMLRLSGLVLTLVLCISWVAPDIQSGAAQRAGVVPAINSLGYHQAAVAPAALAPMEDTEHVRLVDHQGGRAGPVVVQGSYAYAGFGNELAVLDISNPTQPWRVGFSVLPIDIEYLWKFGDAIFASGYQNVTESGGSLHIVGIKDPAAPIQMGSIDFPGWPAGLAANGAHVFVSASPYGGVDTFPGLIHIIDYSDPFLPVKVGEYDPPGDPAGMFVQNHYLYLAELGDQLPTPQIWGGLRILDISDPAHPVEMNFTVTARFAKDVVVVGDLAYVVDHFSGLWIFDVSDPGDVIKLGNAGIGRFSDDLAVMDGFAYITNQELGMVVVDARDPYTPVVIAGYQPPDYWMLHDSGVAADNGLVLIGGGTPVLRIMDVAEPHTPELASTYGGPSRVNDLEIDGNYLYVADGDHGIWVYDRPGPNRENSPARSKIAMPALLRWITAPLMWPARKPWKYTM